MKNQNQDKKEAFKYRLWLTKKGDAKYLSHHDVALIFQQSLRRADLPVAMSGDYNPRMKISFHTSVSVGIASDGEPMDFVLTQDVGSEDIQQRLQKNLPQGMEVVRLEKLLSSHTKYFLQVKNKIQVASFIPVEKSLELINSPKLLVTRIKNNSTKEVDIRPFLKDFTIQNPTPQTSILSLTITMTPQGGASVWEILSLCEVKDISVSITRTQVDLIPFSEKEVQNPA